MKHKKQILITVLSVLISVGLVATAAYATTTIGTDITTGGTLTLSGAVATGIYMSGTYSTAGLQIGNSTTAITLTDADDRAIEIYTTSDSIAGGTSVLPIYLRHTVLGTGGVGHRAEFHTRCDVAAGSYINALKGYMEFDAALTAGRTTGLASAVCAEMKMPNSAVGTGEYYPLEIELVGQSAGFKGVSSGFMTLRASGTLDGVNSDSYFMQVSGLSAGATAMLSETSQTLKTLIGTHQTGSARYLVLSQMADGLKLGTDATTPMALGTSVTKRAIEVYTSSTSTTGTSVLPIYMQHTVLGTGGVGHRAEFHTRCDVAAGSYINALKGYMEFDAALTAGRTTGLASAVCAEMKMPNSAVGTGEYYPLEIELVGQSAGFKGVSSGFMTLRASGTLDGVNSDSYFMQVSGLSAGATAMLSANSQTLKTLIGTHQTGSVRYLVLSQAEDSLSLASTDATGGGNEILVTSTFTTSNAVAHKAILANVSYAPITGDTGGSVPIAVAGMVTLAAGKTHDALYMWGVQGGINFGNSSEVASSQIAAGRFVLEDGTSVTFTSGNIAGIYVDNLVDADMAGISGNADLIRLANHGGTMDNAIHVYGKDVTNLFFLSGTSVGGMTSAHVADENSSGRIKINVDGNTFYLYYYN